MSNVSTQKGVVKFCGKKGFGFIYIESAMSKPESERTKDEELFFHVSAVLAGPNNEIVELRTGDEVQFEVAEGDRGQTAINIVRTKAVFEKNRTNLPSTNVTVAIRKTHVPLLSGILKDLVAGPNRESFKDAEIEAMEEFRKTLLNAESKMVYSSNIAGHSQKTNKSSKKNGTSATA
jgi:cold shock CspA family protein